MATETPGGTLLVPVANPETVERLLDTAIDIAHGQSMRIVLLHVVEVPPQVPLSAGDSLIDDDGEEVQLLDDAVKQATDADLAVESRMRYARDIATGIVGAVDVHDADALLVGWRGHLDGATSYWGVSSTEFSFRRQEDHLRISQQKSPNYSRANTTPKPLCCTSLKRANNSSKSGPQREVLKKRDF